VFADKGGGLTFVACDEISDMDAAEALAGIVPSVRALVARRGCDDADGPDAFQEGAPTLAHLASAAVQGTTALGHQAGARTRWCGAAPARRGATPPARA
jgi:hypothetical protein